ncbi:cell envelope biogenesis protein TolA, partial [Sphingomonas sp. GC_Shp_2]
PAPVPRHETPKPKAEPVKEKPAKPAPKAEAKPAPKADAKPAPARSAPAKSAKSDAAPAKTAAKAPATPAKAKPVATTGKGKDATAKATRPHGSRLGDDFLKGLADAPAKPAPAAAAPAAKVGAQQMADIGSAISRQVQPCANRQVQPGPGAERIRVIINLRLNRDGSLAARPRITGHDGVDDENQRYLARVDDLAIATFTGCAPLRGLPDSLYDVQNGWSNFTMRYKLPG